MMNDKWHVWWNEYKESGAIEEMSKEYRKKEAKKRESITEKTCSSCNKTQPLSEYHCKSRKRKDNSTYKSYRAECRTCRNYKAKAYRKDNPDVIKAYNSTPKRKADRASRKRLKKVCKSHNAVPNWLSQEHKQQIRDIYMHMQDCRAITGEEYHVDHIVPLQGDVICGLHVPWNLQVLPSDVNVSKSNKWDWGDMDP